MTLGGIIVYSIILPTIHNRILNNERTYLVHF